MRSANRSGFLAPAQTLDCARAVADSLAPHVAEPSLALDAPLARLRGVGPTTAAALSAAGLHTVLDLLSFFPTRHRDVETTVALRDDLVGRVVRFDCEVLGTSRRFLPGRRSLVTVRVAAADGGLAEVAYFNQPYLKNAFVTGARRVAEGTLRKQGRRYVLSPGRLTDPARANVGPVVLRYAPIEGVSEARLRGLLRQALTHADLRTGAVESLPAGLEADVMPWAEAVLAMHQPVSSEQHERARRGFALREAVRVFAVIEQARRRRARATAPPVRFSAELEARLQARIALTWTADQAAALLQVRAALSAATPMGLLLQGDVGTGKTAVAVWGALAAIASGLQVAFLAPTELLAEQHFAKVGQWLEGSRVGVALLTGSLGRKERAAADAMVAGGQAQLVFGTHALLSASTRFARLGLVIIDEQHRFGVEQRQALVRKGEHPHLLVLTATPIPRTLTLALFGDLDVAVLRQRPQRTPPAPARHARGKASLARALHAIARRVARGQGTFVVCPTIGEEDEKHGAIAMHAALSRRFACGLVHGRMQVADRHAAVRRFRAGEFAVLVGTTVLEVGLDVPRATLMVIVEAERFGLATLHQLRGRVGRGSKRGLCVLLGAESQRTRALCRTTDGFEIAELDLALRGSGELLGLRQSGPGELRALDPVADLEMLLRVRQAVQGVGAVHEPG